MPDDNPIAPDSSAETAPEPSAEDSARAEAIAEIETEMRGEEPSTVDKEPTAPASAGPPADAGDEGKAATAEAEKADAQAAEPDPWADAPEAAKAAYDAKAAEAVKAEHARSSAEGRLAAAERRLAELTAVPRGPARTEPKPESDGAKAADEAFSKFAEDYPDVAEPVKAMFDALKGEISSLRTEKDAMERSVRTLGEDRLSTVYAEQEAQVIAAHPEFAEIGASEPNERSRDFVAWYEGQPQFVRQAVEANAAAVRDASAVNRILDMYKRDRGLSGDANGAQAAEASPEAARRAMQVRGARGGPRPSAGARASEGAEQAESIEDIRRGVERDIKNAAQAAGAY